jgi:PiT family inorganic phosphate transporter
VSSHLGFALSTTQVCSGSIIGSGLGKKGNKVNWGVAGRMVIAWLVTFPVAGVFGAVACAIARLGMGGVIVVALIGIAAALVILRLSRRNPVNSANVNDSAEVKLNPSNNAVAAQ